MKCRKKLERENKLLITLLLSIKSKLEWSTSSDNRPTETYYGALFKSDMKDMKECIDRSIKKIDINIGE